MSQVTQNVSADPPTSAPASARSPYVTFLENPHQLEVIDQRKLPQTEVKVRLRTVEDVKKAIELMIVRGAPLIGICGAFGMALAGEFNEDLDAMKRQLDSTRPTAVNLMHCTARMCAFAKKSKEHRARMFEEAKQIAEEEFAACEKMAEYGARLIPLLPREDQTTVNVIHHCNTGGLATFGVGTALGSITRRAKLVSNLFVWVDETRPRLQGAKLTSWELNKAKIPNSVIADGAAGLLLQTGRADCILFGADRVTANGDVVNKIGTYPLAVVGRENGVPVYCVAPTSTLDLSLANGQAVKIEERGDEELLEFEGKRFVDEATQGYNPAFDITPFRYLTAIVTEEGVCYPPFRESLAAAKAHALARQHGQALGGVPELAPVLESGNLVAMAAASQDSIEAITQILDKTSLKKTTSTGSRLFPDQGEPFDAKSLYHREDRRAVKPKTYLGDGSAEPKIEHVKDNTRPSSRNFIGDEEAGDIDHVAPSNIRTFAEIKKSSLVLSDEAPTDIGENKASIRVTQKAKSSAPFGAENDVVVGDGVRKAKKPSPVSGGRTIPTDEDVEFPSSKNLLTARGHVQPPSHPSTSIENPPTAKGHVEPVKSPGLVTDLPSGRGHFEPPKRPEGDRPLSKAHIVPPSPERASAPQTKGHVVSPSQMNASNIFG